MLAKWLISRWVFLVSVTVVWLACFAGSWLGASIAANWVGIEWETAMGRQNLLDLPLLIVGLAVAIIAAGTYYVVGRKVLRLLGIWDDDLVEYSFREIRDSRQRGYREFRRGRRK